MPLGRNAAVLLAVALTAGTLVPGSVATIAGLTSQRPVTGNTFTTAANFGSTGLTFVGKADFLLTQATLPTFTPGDLAIVFAFKSSATAPALPAGWANIDSSSVSGGNANSARVGYRVLQAGDLTTGIWTNAAAVQVVVLRGQHAVTPIGGFASGNNSGTLLAYNALTLANTSGSSWVVGFAGHNTATNVNSPTVSGMTRRAPVVGSLGLHTAEGISSFSVGLYGSSVNLSGGWRTYAIEVRR